MSIPLKSYSDHADTLASRVSRRGSYSLKTGPLKGFGLRMRGFRRERGLTQRELAKSSGLSHRMIAYYEQDDAQPPGAIVVALARALQVSTDELLGLKTSPEQISLRASRLRKRLQAVEQLPSEDQRAVLKYVDSLRLARARLEDLQRNERKRRRAA